MIREQAARLPRLTGPAPRAVAPAHCKRQAVAPAASAGGRGSLDGGYAAVAPPPRSHQLQLQQQQAVCTPSAEQQQLHPVTTASFSQASAAGPLAAPLPAGAALLEVYVIIFSAVGPDLPPAGEGIYSLRTPGLDGLPVEIILAFEARADCERYAALVEAEGILDAHAAAVVGLPPRELASFCSDAGYACRLELAGSALRPPAASVPMTDYERAARLRAGTGFRVLEVEPARGCATAQQSDTPSVRATQAHTQRRPRPRSPPLGPWLHPRRAAGGMAELVAALEGLLPRDV